MTIDGNHKFVSSRELIEPTDWFGGVVDPVRHIGIPVPDVIEEVVYYALCGRRFVPFPVLRDIAAACAVFDEAEPEQICPECLRLNEFRQTDTSKIRGIEISDIH